MTRRIAVFHRWVALCLRSQALIAKSFRFACIGAFSGAIFLVVTAVLAGSFGVEPKVASVAGYLVSMPANFVGNKRFSFRSDGPIWGDLLRFGVLHTCNVLLTMGAMGATVNVLNWHFGFGAVTAIVLVPMVNFFVMNGWVFGRSAKRLEHAQNRIR